jgi:hypothetical protein
VKAAFAIWNELQGEMPNSEVKRMEEQATRFLESLWREIGAAEMACHKPAIRFGQYAFWGKSCY